MKRCRGDDSEIREFFVGIRNSDDRNKNNTNNNKNDKNINYK